MNDINESKLIEAATGHKYPKQDIEAALDYPLSYKGIVDRFIHHNPNIKWNSYSRTWTLTDRQGNVGVISVDQARAKLALIIKRMTREYVIVRDARKAGILTSDFNVIKYQGKLTALQREAADVEVFEYIYNTIKTKTDTKK